MITAQDWSSLATAVTTEVSTAMPVILTVAGGLLAVMVAWKFVKRFLR